MKSLFPLLLLFICCKSFGQLTGDPAVEQVSFTNIAGIAIDDTLALGYVAQLNVPVKNLDPNNGLPAGSCKLKIGLGTKMILDPSFDLSSLSSSQYFEWTAAFVGGQIQITGDLKVPLPANYSEIVKFNVQGSILEYSTITTNFLVSNHNTQVILSDGDPTNNSSFRLYKIIPPVATPVNFTGLLVYKRDCSIDVSFSIENEINVHHYEIETSKDAVVYNKAAEITAANQRNYKFSLPINASISTPHLYIRIRSVDRDDSYKYSMIKTMDATCTSKQSFLLFPNPVSNEQYVTVMATGDLLNGKYSAQLFDAAGRLISGREYNFNNQQQFTYPISNIAAGQYIMKLIQAKNDLPVVIKIQKL